MSAPLSDKVTIVPVSGEPATGTRWRVARQPDGSYGPHIGRTFVTDYVDLGPGASKTYAAVISYYAGDRYLIDFGGVWGRVPALLVASESSAAQLDAGRASDMLAAATEDVRRLELAISERKRVLYAALGKRAAQHAAMVFDRRRIGAQVELACAEIVAMDAQGIPGSSPERALLSLQVNAMEAACNALGFRIAAAELEMRQG